MVMTVHLKPSFPFAQADTPFSAKTRSTYTWRDRCWLRCAAMYIRHAAQGASPTDFVPSQTLALKVVKMSTRPSEAHSQKWLCH
jgi:hypothetical protein